MTATKAKKQALAKHLNCQVKEISVTSWGTFDACGGEYLVFTGNEARHAAEKEIKSSLWAFHSEFLVDYMPILERSSSVIGALSKLQGTLCEDANELIVALTRKRFKRLVDDAIGIDGLGHFLSRYDGKEREEIVDGKLFQIFRV